MERPSSQPVEGLPASPPQVPARSLGRWVALFAVLVGAVASLWGAYAWRNRPAPTPGPTGPTSPFLNTRPGVKYVGSARCTKCHSSEASTYAHHPMGRSVSPASSWLPPQHKAVASFQVKGIQYAVERRGLAIFHREFVPAKAGPVPAEFVAEVAFAVGSGQQGQSFLVDRGGYLFQSPISWYTSGKTWRLSPGFERNNEHFSRYVVEACLFCHTNEARTEPDTLNHYRPAPVQLEAIGCERCHGPGELHVAARAAGERPKGKDLSIVNPRHLEPVLRDAVCQQCHLQGESRIVRRGKSLYDYRPGLPLHEFVAVFLRPPGQADARKAVSHVEQMHTSRCFQASSGKMGCISCHDPHVMPSEKERVRWYRGRCLNCHKETSCTPSPERRRRQSPADSCIDCHMPRGDSSNVAHTAVTDHRIVRRSDAPAPAGEPAEVPLVPFYPNPLGSGLAGAQRDMGLALGELLSSRPAPEAQRRQLARWACGLLGEAVQANPDDVAALEGLGLALRKDRRPREALATLEEVLKQAPRRELSLEHAARAAMELGEQDRSIAYWQRLVEVNPHMWHSQGFLAQALAHRERWADAIVACRASLKLNPFETLTRLLLIGCLVHNGEKKQARAEFDALLALRPEEADRLRQWFAEEMRPTSPKR